MGKVVLFFSFLIAISLVVYTEDSSRIPSSEEAKIYRGFDHKNTKCALDLKCWFIKLQFPKELDSKREALADTRLVKLEELSKMLNVQNPDRDTIAIALKELQDIEKQWDKHLDKIEVTAAKSYEKNIKTPKIQKATIFKDGFTVKPFVVFTGENSRTIRWVSNANLNASVSLFNSNGEEHFITVDENPDSPFKEVELKELAEGEWNYVVKLEGQNHLKESGSFKINPIKTIIFLADSQDSLELLEKSLATVNDLVKDFKIDLLVHGGDINSWGSNEFEMIEAAKLFNSLEIPSLFIKGNHEFFEAYGYDDNASYFSKLFSIDSKSNSDSALYRLGEEGQFQLMIWDTNFFRMSPDDFIKQDQLLKQALINNEERPLILAGHHGVLSKGWHGSSLGSQSDDWIMQLYLDKLFRKNRLPILLAGHDHVYQRIVDEESIVKTQHITAGAASAQLLYPYFNSFGTVKSIARKRTATIVHTSEDSLTVKTFDLTNKEIIDSFEYK